MDEIVRLAVGLHERINGFGISKYLALPEKDKQDLNKLFYAIREFLSSGGKD